MAAAPALAPAPATLRVTSRSTLVTGDINAPVHHAPGTPVEMDAAEAADLIARGIAVAADAPAPEAAPPTVTVNTTAPAGGATVTQGA
jgi:hypothetical protein